MLHFPWACEHMKHKANKMSKNFKEKAKVLIIVKQEDENLYVKCKAKI